ncbi:MAG: TonB-dependent receptor [Acidobacteria bacterium]|nr:TonB-dependent receptor [Acidobacteriota bacterium]
MAGVISIFSLCGLILILSAAAEGQNATLHGVVTDQTGARVSGAAVMVTDGGGTSRTVDSDQNGNYFFPQLEAGVYILQASAPGMATKQPLSLTLRPGGQGVNLTLVVLAEKQKIEVEDQSGPTISAENVNNAGSITLRGNDLQALGDSQEDLAQDLQALAGPSAGPSGGQFYMDGFSGGSLPTKESIREIKINQNPFSPEYDKLGYGRIEVSTKSGGEKMHGLGFFNVGDSVWNSRDPYAQQKAPFLLREYGGNLGGPITPALAYFLDVEGAAIDNGAIINGFLVAQPAFTISPFNSVFTVPQRRIIVSPRLDYKLAADNLFSFLYRVEEANVRDSGVGSLNLETLSNHVHFLSHTFQASETATIGDRLVNQARFQFFRIGSSTLPNTPGYEIQVLGAFNGGGSQLGPLYDTQNNFEVQDYVTLIHQDHTLHFGIRVRATSDANISRANFAGTFIFAGGTGPELNANNQPILAGNGNPVVVPLESIERYRRTLLFQQLGYSPVEIRALGGGATQFRANAGEPPLSASQADLGVFFGDEWHIRPNLIISSGLRYEWQTNLNDRRDFAPRLGLSWHPEKSKFTFRAGWGIFYERFALGDVITALRFNGIRQRQFIVYNPDSYPLPPPITVPSSLQELSPSLRTPYLMQSVLSIERQLARNTTIAVTYSNTHGLRQLRTENRNAPLPGTFNPSVPGSGIFPLGFAAPVFQMLSAGLYNQNQVVINANSRLSSAFSFFGTYTFNRALSNTDGLTTLPANPYNFLGEYGPAATDVRNSLSVGASYERWRLRIAPMLTVRSGPPFDITTGSDLYGDTLFNARPGIVSDSSKPGLVETRYGLLDPNPAPGEATLSRNYGRGPGYLLLNLRLTKLFEFGGRSIPSRVASPNSSGQTTSSEGHRYTISLAASLRNVLNHKNPGPIIGDITSPLFGQANQTYGATTLGGTGFLETANNRRLELQAKFIF